MKFSFFFSSVLGIVCGIGSVIALKKMFSAGSFEEATPAALALLILMVLAAMAAWHAYRSK